MAGKGGDVVRNLIKICFGIAAFLPFLVAGVVNAQDTRADKAAQRLSLILGSTVSPAFHSSSPVHGIPLEVIRRLCEKFDDRFKFCDLNFPQGS